jgi:hypothetical protein
MMRTRSILMALIVTMLAPLPLLAQGGGQGRGGMGGGAMAARMLLEQGSVEFLVSKATDLQLNEEQATAMKAIGAKWAEETKANRDRIRADMPQAGGMGGGDREALMQRFQALQPLFMQLQESDEKAMAEAMKHLNETQQATAKKLVEERRAPRRPGGA